MAATLDRQEMFRLARMGAEARLRALEEERNQILRSFPGLKAGGSSSPATVQGGSAAGPRSGAVVKCLPRSVRASRRV